MLIAIATTSGDQRPRRAVRAGWVAPLANGPPSARRVHARTLLGPKVSSARQTTRVRRRVGDGTHRPDGVLAKRVGFEGYSPSWLHTTLKRGRRLSEVAGKRLARL